MQPMNEVPFETALGERVEDMLDACTRCGKCVEVCPSVEPAGISDTKSEDIIGGILELVRTGNGPEASRKWAQSCMQSGECIKACDYGVNPRFLLTMARLGIAKAENELPNDADRAWRGTATVSRGVTVLSRLQLDTEVLERLGQKSASVSAPVEAPGLRVLHRLQCAQDPAHRLACPRYHGCARRQLPGDGRTEPLLRHHATRPRRRRDGWSHGLEHHGEAVALQVGPGDLLVPELLRPVHRTILPTMERQRGSRPFEMNPFMRFLDDRLAQLKPHLQRQG